MVPRSLAAAIAIGAASGAVAALALPESGVQQGPLRLEPDAYRHDPGARVDLNLANFSDAPLPLGRLEVSGLAGAQVYARELPGELAPGESARLSWDQTGPGGGPAFSGIYRVSAGIPPASAVVEISGAGLRGD